MRKRILTILIILLFSVYALPGATAFAVYFQLGERILQLDTEGPDVAILQARLKEAGYYPYKIDGIYGPLTMRAVKMFQEKMGLAVDGIVGPKTLERLKLFHHSPSRADVSREDFVLLARTIHAEARGESFKGQVAVGAVILNRVSSKEFPDSIREVILQEGQFSCVSDGQVHLYPSKMAFEAARAALLGYDPTGGALYYYNPRVANLSWISYRPVIKRIGNHVFAR